MTINVALGSGGKAQQFAQTMAMSDACKRADIGDIRVWVEPDETIYMIIDSKYRTPVELTAEMGEAVGGCLERDG